MSESAITQGITANLIAPMMLTHQALVGMRARRRGAIAMVSSVAGEFASRNAAPYGASKAGLTMFTTTLQRELRREPIDLMLVILGEVQTAMLDQVRADPVMSQIGKRVGKMRSLTPQEVAHGMADGIERGRARLIMPTAASGLVMLRNVPTRVMDAALIGVD
jgi:short-subunit dehydrogenase